MNYVFLILIAVILLININHLFGAVRLMKNADIDKKNILDMLLDLMDVEFFHFQLVYLFAI